MAGEVLPIVLSGRDETAAAFNSLKRNAQGAQGAVNQLGGAFASLGNADIGSLLSLPSALQGLGGAAGAIAAIAAPIAIIAYSASKIKEGAVAFGDYARSVRNATEQSELGAVATQALLDLFQRHGVESDKATAAINKFALAHAEAAAGGGALYKELLRINPALAEQFASTKSNAAALEIYAGAVAKADEGTRRLLLQPLGKGAGALGATFVEIAGKGGLGAVSAAALASGAAIDEGIINRFSLAAIEAERKSHIVERSWNEAYAQIYLRWKEFKNEIGLGPDNEIKIAVSVKRIAEGDFSPSESPVMRPAASLLAGLNWLFSQRGWIERGVKAIGDKPSAAGAVTLGADLGGAAGGGAERTSADRALDETNRLTRVIELERARIGILGAVATEEEKIRFANDEVALKNRGIGAVSAERLRLVKEENALREHGATIALKTSLGVVSALDLEDQKRAELNLMLKEQKINEDEYAKALAHIPAIVREINEAQEVRMSTTPQLVRLRQESDNLAASLDGAFASSLRSGATDLRQFSMGAVSLGDTLSNLGKRFIEAGLDAFYMKSIIGPTSSLFSGALSSILGGGALGGAGGGGGEYAMGGAFERGMRVTAFARGGVVSRPTLFPMANGAGLMGEAGPEAVMPLRRMNSGRLGVEMAGGGGAGVSVHFGDINIGAGNAVTRAEVAEQMNALASKIVPVVREAIKRRAL